jgi:hypothetical protein
MLGIMIGIIVIIVLVAFIEPIKNQIRTARNSDNLDCTNTSISTGQQMSCIIVDVTLPYFLGVGVAVAAGYIGMRSLFGGKKDLE